MNINNIKNQIYAGLKTNMTIKLPIFVGLYSMMLLSAYIAGQRGNDLEDIKHTPIKVEQKKLNNDTIEDRVITLGNGEQQNQYGWVESGETTYVTLGQIKENKVKYDRLYKNLKGK